MRFLSLNFLLVAFLAGRPLAAQTTEDFLQNDHAKYVFQYDPATSEVWLSSAELDSASSGQVVDFVRRSIWQVELRVDPVSVGSTGVETDETLTFTAADFVPGSLVFSGPQYFNLPNNKVLMWEWTGTVASSNSAVSPVVLVRSFWRLKNNEDFAETIVEVQILNAAQSPHHKVWNSSYPRLQIANLDDEASSPPPGHEASDVLATGRYGGITHGDPINYSDVHGNRFSFQTPYDQNTGMIDLSPTDPGIYAVPVVTYYDTEREVGLYLANSDDQGHFKGIFLDPLAKGDPTAIDPGGALRFEVMQFPDGNIWQADYYLSPYHVHVGVHHGDWVDAAQKYKRFRRKAGDGLFDWVEGLSPSGAPSNLGVPQSLKTNPLHGRIQNQNGTPYCVGNLVPGVLGGSSPTDSMAADLDYFTSRYGIFSRLMFERNLVAYDEVHIAQGFVPSPLSPVLEMNQLAVDAALAGHPVLLDSLTEKFWLTDTKSLACNKLAYRDCPNYPGLANYDYCCSINSSEAGQARRLAYSNARIRSRNGAVANAPCPAGLSVLTGYPGAAQGNPCAPPAMTSEPSFVVWFARMVSAAVNYYSAEGGLRFNAPSVSIGACFARDHDHEPGFGTWFLEAWTQLLEDIRTTTGRPNLPVTIETSNAVLTELVRVQNPWSVDAPSDLQNRGPNYKNSQAPDKWDEFFDAPIRKVPMMQMIADEVRYATQYGFKTLMLPYTDFSDVGPTFPAIPATSSTPEIPASETTYFRKYPSVSGALSNWMMAKRVLGHQSLISISNDNFNLDLVQSSVDSNNKRALEGTLDFYNSLASFLTAAGPTGPNMDYLGGSMERNVEFDVSPLHVAVERFTVPASVISPAPPVAPISGSPFPDLAAVFDRLVMEGAAPHPGDLSFEGYRPYDDGLFRTASGSAGSYVKPLAPVANLSWLPHGVYRHWDRSNKLAILVANPWSVEHKVENGGLKPMNPFDFNFGKDTANPAVRTYAFSFDFDPNDYEGFASGTPFSVEEVQYDEFGVASPSISHGTATAATTFSSSLTDGHFAAFFVSTP